MKGLVAALAAAAVSMGCTPPSPRVAPAVGVAPGADAVRHLRGLPPIAVVVRDGDPRGAIAVAVATGGLPDAGAGRGAEVAVALAAVVEGRLEGKLDAQVLPGWSGYRVRALVAEGAEAGRAAEALRAAMLAPVGDADMARVKKKLAALAARPMRDPALEAAVRCRGEAFGAPARTDARADGPTVADVEGWRKAAHGTGRVAFGTVGSARIGDDVAHALGQGGAWPDVAPPPAEPLPPAEGAPAIYDATGDLPPGAARTTLAVFVPRAAAALAVAPAVGDPRGPLASRLGALDAPARVREVVATAHARGGCLAVTFEMAARDLGDGAPARIATAVALARQELAVELEGAPTDSAAARAAARGATDPREAAERAAWWAIADDRTDGAGTRAAIAIGIAGGREAPRDGAGGNPLHTAVRSALDRATVAWHEPVMDVRTRVERGQGEVWVLVGSPCGTAAEAEGDAGLGAGAALAMIKDAADVTVEPYVTPEGVGVLAHGRALPAESATAHARRVADAAARAFAAEPVDPARASLARAQLLRAAEQDEGRAMTALALAAAPQRPSWLVPFGTADALGRSSDAAVGLRVSALRAGPIRVAALANVDAAQADAAARATDRWVARRPGEGRACPASTVPAAPRPGTYPVETTGGTTEAVLALPLAPGDAAATAAATTLAYVLDGPGGLLASALGSAGLARSWSARVLGGKRAAALVVRVTTAAGALDAAVAQTRALLDRLHQGALGPDDLTRATAARAAADLASSLDPRARLAALFRADTDAAPATSPPTLEAVRAFAAAALKDDALVIVATRPRAPRSP